MRRGQQHTEVTRAKMRELWTPERRDERSASLMGKKRSAETKAKMSKSHTDKILTEEHKAKIRVTNTGKTRSEETKTKISAVVTEHWKDPEYRDKQSGENHHNWQGGSSFEPYCSLFNNTIKEKIRNRDGRVCVSCGKSEILNGQRLSIHHIDGDKTQGCNGKKWYLCALCRSCNSKTDTIEKEFMITTNMMKSMRGGE